VRTRGVLKASTNRVRTSTALQGNSMWENVIGITEQQAGTNTGVEALINAPTIGGGRKATQARRQAAAEAVMATGGFDTSITNYQSLLAMAKQQGAVGSGTRGACKVCGQMGHLTKQCRNGVVLPGGGGDAADAADAAAALPQPVDGGEDSMGSLSLSDDSSDEERRRCLVDGGVLCSCMCVWGGGLQLPLCEAARMCWLPQLLGWLPHVCPSQGSGPWEALVTLLTAACMVLDLQEEAAEGEEA
jgi:hypothetical protein